MRVRCLYAPFLLGKGEIRLLIARLLRLLELLPDVRWGRGREVLSRRELIAALGLHQSARRNFRDNYLKPATAQGLVKMQFPEVPSRPEQAYQLTAKGTEHYQSLVINNEQK